MKRAEAATLGSRLAALARRDHALAVSILREVVRLPEDWVDRPAAEGGDPKCGLSNHEGARIEYLARVIREIGAVRDPSHVAVDGFGNLVWTVEDPSDGIPARDKRVILMDGHCDTVRALRPDWAARVAGIDPYRGLVDPVRLDRAALRREAGYVPPDDEWEHLVFGRGTSDQLGGVVSQIVATRILLELASEGALRGVIVRGYATVAEEDNDGGGPLYLMRRELPGAPPERIPDVVILTDSTGDAARGALGIYRGQRGRMQIEVRVDGRSCHGSMPWQGLNPLEHGGAILAEAARRHEAREGFLEHPFLGPGTRTASFATLETPSDCAVPSRFTFRFDRRLTLGETPEAAIAGVESLETVRAARAAGLQVTVSVPVYAEPTWKGAVPGNPQIYMGWVTPEEHPAIRAAVECYRDVVTPRVRERAAAGGTIGRAEGGALRAEPRVGRWIFSTDGVGYPVPLTDRSIAVPERKGWVTSGACRHPAMFGFGTGLEQNAHVIGECLDTRELEHAIAFLARYPGAFAEAQGE